VPAGSGKRISCIQRLFLAIRAPPPKAPGKEEDKRLKSGPASRFKFLKSNED
jgi:hypothetical protein